MIVQSILVCGEAIVGCKNGTAGFTCGNAAAEPRHGNTTGPSWMVKDSCRGSLLRLVCSSPALVHCCRWTRQSLGEWRDLLGPIDDVVQADLTICELGDQK